jgi:hypothetical protein
MLEVLHLDKPLAERIVMCLAEVGVRAEVIPDWDEPGQWLYRLEDARMENKRAARKASALVRLSQGIPETFCIEHASAAHTNPCHGVACTDVLRDPGVTCGA